MSNCLQPGCCSNTSNHVDLQEDGAQHGSPPKGGIKRLGKSLFGSTGLGSGALPRPSSRRCAVSALTSHSGTRAVPAPGVGASTTLPVFLLISAGVFRGLCNVNNWHGSKTVHAQGACRKWFLLSVPQASSAATGAWASWCGGTPWTATPCRRPATAGATATAAAAMAAAAAPGAYKDCVAFCMRHLHTRQKSLLCFCCSMRAWQQVWRFREFHSFTHATAGRFGTFCTA